MRWDDSTNHTAWGGKGFQFYNLTLGSGSTFTDQIAAATVGRVSGVFSGSQTNYWSPRFGFAWDRTKSGKWSLRGGVGQSFGERRFEGLQAKAQPCG